MQTLLNEAIYRKNIEALGEKIEYFSLVKRIESERLPSDCQVCLSSTGKPIIVWLKQGEKVYFASLVDPEKEAVRFVKSLDLHKRLEINIVGIGVGYHIDELLKTAALDRINVIGLNLSWFKLLLWIRDITDWIRDERVNLLIDLNDVELLNGLNIRLFMDRVLGRPLVAEFHPITTHFPKRTRHIIGLIRDSILNARVCTVTNISVCQQVVRNSLLNFPYLLKSPGMELWYDRFKGKSVFCISAGPSLRENLSYIREHQNNAVIVAVDTAVPILQKEDICPDIVVGLDFSLENKKHYLAMDLEKLSKTILVAAVDIYEDILPLWRGPKVVLHSSHMFSKFIHRKLGLFKGITTSHMAFLFCVFSGADPIILFGLDLSYPDLKYSHIEGAVNRTNLTLIKEKGVEILAKRSGKKIKYVWARRLPSVDGSEVISEDIYVGFLRDFERIIEVCPQKVIDTKNAGAKITGTILMPIEEVIQQFCSYDLSSFKEALPELVRFSDLLFDREGFESFWEEYTDKIGQLRQLIKNAFKEIELITKGKEKDCEFSQETLGRINNFLDEIFDEKYFSVMQLAQQFSGAVMVLIRKFLTLNQGQVSHRERTDVILAFLEAIEKALDEISQLFDTARERYICEGILCEK